MSDKVFWYEKNGEKHCCFTASELKALALSGEIDSSCLIWKEGTKNWIPATSVKGLLPAEPPAAPLQDSISPVYDSFSEVLEVKEEATKNCDFCGEQILAIAKKCKYCKSMLDGSGVSKKSSLSWINLKLNDIKNYRFQNGRELFRKKQSNIENEPFLTYDQVPWYRRNWFAIFCGVFFAPAIIPTLLTGSFYYQKENQIIKYSNFARVFLILWSVSFSVVFVVKIFDGSLFENGNVALVKNGTLNSCPNTTVKQMVDSYMGNPSWESGVSEDGEVFVNVGGDIHFVDKPVRAVIQFSVNEKKGSFEYTALEFNGVPQMKLLAIPLMGKMCESASKLK